MLFLALQPCHLINRSCRHCQCPFQCPFCRPPPSPTLVTVTITITLFVAIAIARPPPLSPSPSLLPPSPFPLRHPPPSSLSPSPLPPSPLPSLSHTSLVTITITLTHVIAITIAIALLVTVNRLPPSLPLLLPPKPSLSSLHPTIVANVIARSIPLTLFVTHHPYPHRHRLSALTLFVTCSHRYLIVFFTFIVGWAMSQQVCQHAMI
jgi:hypothetical protein